MKLDVDKFEVIRSIPGPQTVRKVQEFIGTVGFIPNFLESLEVEPDVDVTAYQIKVINFHKLHSVIWNDSNEEDGKSMKKEGMMEEYQKDEEYNSLIESGTLTCSMVYGIEFELYKGLPIKQTPKQIFSGYQM